MRYFSRPRSFSSDQLLICLVLILLAPSPAWAADSARADAAACLAYAAIVGQSPLLVTPAKPAPLDQSISEPINYRDAYARYKSEQRPMVVMVTASWCPVCPAMKRELLQLKMDGKLPGVSVVIIDHDQDPLLARSVLGERRTLPALSVYQYVAGQAQEARPQRISELLPTLYPAKTTVADASRR